MMLLIAGLWLFLGIHSVAIVVPGFKAVAVERLTTNGWKGLYSLIAITGFVLICLGYGEARIDHPVWLYRPPRRCATSRCC